MSRCLLSVAIAALRLASGITVTAPSSVGAPQKLPAFAAEVGTLRSRYDEATWQSPESVLAALQSKMDDVRLAGFHLLGAEEEDAHEMVHYKNADMQEVATPWQSELRYVALGDDGVQEAVVAVQVRNLVIVAIAAFRNGKWHRIAAFTCICPSNNTGDSYGSGNGGDLLGTTLDIGRFLDRSFQRNELILRVFSFPTKGDYVASFDEYVQYETHYRLFGGALKQTITFSQRLHSCRSEENVCAVTRRWFYHHAFGPSSTIPGAIMVEAEGVADRGLREVFRTDVEDRNLKFKSCVTMLFNEKMNKFEFSPPPPLSLDACGFFAQNQRQPAVHQFK